MKFSRSAQSTYYNQRVIVKTRKSEENLLVEGPASEDGRLARSNVTIAYMSFDGLGYEDAIVFPPARQKMP